MIAPTWRIEQGHVLDLLRAMPSESVQCVITSPPYFGLRSYSTEAQVWSDGWVGELGLEPTVQLYVQHIVEIFREVRRVLRKDGTLWMNIGDSYVACPTGHQDISATNGKAAAMFAKGGRYRLDNLRKDGAKARGTLKPKDLYMVPARVALALQDDGWWLRSEITWCKRAPMPESVTDRPTSATEKIFLLTKSERYYYDQEAVAERSTNGENFHGGYVGSGNRTQAENGRTRPDNQTTTRNQWNYWLLSPDPFPAAHFATFPTEIPRRCISAGTSEKGCCGACGSPWRRVVERLAGDPTGWKQSEGASQKHAGRIEQGLVSTKSGFNRGSKEDYYANAPQNLTTGWQPSCKCGADVVPCTVLDPFAGSGTTLMVALRLGRSAIGLELQGDYVQMATRRVVNDSPLFNWQETPA